MSDYKRSSLLCPQCANPTTAVIGRCPTCGIDAARTQQVQRLEAAIDRMDHAPDDEVDPDEYARLMDMLVELRAERDKAKAR